MSDKRHNCLFKYLNHNLFVNSTSYNPSDYIIIYKLNFEFCYYLNLTVKFKS